MTVYGQTLGVFKRENNECIRNGEKTNLHKIKNVVFYFFYFALACENSRPFSLPARNATRAGSEEGRLFSQARFRIYHGGYYVVIKIEKHRCFPLSACKSLELSSSARVQW